MAEKNKVMGHKPILLEESLAPLIATKGKFFVDGTLGGGGHLSHLLESAPQARVLGIDRDEAAIQRVAQKFPEEVASGRLILRREKFSNLSVILNELGLPSVDGVFIDIGFSSFQVDDAMRGMSFLRDGPLDMRMDQSCGVTASELINTLSAEELQKIFSEYGEETFSRSIARKIVEGRREAPIETTLRLSELVLSAIPAKFRRTAKVHPATRVFQAIRIAVNEELQELESFLSQIPSVLSSGGAVAILTFHSLEDRLVKQRFKFLSDDCICPPEIITCARCHKPLGKLWAKKPLKPSEAEIAANPRARSAKLRALLRT
jgi:16S rRNA (cytosine1402-N4)-methyltransferase